MRKRHCQVFERPFFLLSDLFFSFSVETRTTPYSPCNPHTTTPHRAERGDGSLGAGHLLCSAQWVHRQPPEFSCVDPFEALAQTVNP